MHFNINSQVPLVNQSEHICGLGNHSALRFPLAVWKKIYSTGSPGASNPGATTAGTSASHTFTLHPEQGWEQSNGPSVD